MKGWRRHVPRLARVLVAAVAALLCAFFLTVALSPMPAEIEHGGSVPSVRVLARGGELLREVRAGDGTLADSVEEADLDGRVARAVVAVEDQRFYRHAGVDPLAIGRALLQNLRGHRVVSGASTITMQLARVLRPHRRSFWGKWREAALAVRIELGASKRDILRAYLNAAPFGAQIRGARRAALQSFGKEPRELSWAEAATLAGLPKSPVAYKMRSNFAPTLARRNVVLGRLLSEGALDDEAWRVAVAEPLAPWRPSNGAGAPHFVRALGGGRLGRPGTAEPGVRAVHTTLSTPLQEVAERSARDHVMRLTDHDVGAASVLVLENATGDVLAYVGSPDFDEPTAGQNDGVLAERQPGSALKPFVYALAIDRAGYTAATSLADVSTQFLLGDKGVYIPQNYDAKFHGPVRVREALGNSYNVPAVRAAEAVGATALVEHLRTLGFGTLHRASADYGIGVALGDGEVRLWDLAYAYAALARGGEPVAPRPVSRIEFVDGTHRDVHPEAGERVIPKHVARIVTDMLADPVARAAQFGRYGALEVEAFAAAAKTGTSKHYRDNWAVGYTREVTVAVWVGNFDGHPMREVSGVTGAGPIMRSVLEAAQAGRLAAPLRITESDGLQSHAVCALSGAAPGPDCTHVVNEWFSPGSAPQEPCAVHTHATVERATGLRAGAGCRASEVEERRFERFEAALSRWAREVGRPLLPGPSTKCPPAENVEGATRTDASSFRVHYPLAGARFGIDPGRPRSSQALRLDVGPLNAGERVDLLVDGTVLLRAVLQADLMWSLEAGAHTLSVRKRSGEVANTHVVVE